MVMWKLPVGARGRYFPHAHWQPAFWPAAWRRVASESRLQLGVDLKSASNSVSLISDANGESTGRRRSRSSQQPGRSPAHPKAVPTGGTLHGLQSTEQALAAFGQVTVPADYPGLYYALPAIA